MKPQTKPFIVVIKPSRRTDNKCVARPVEKTYRELPRLSQKGHLKFRIETTTDAKE